MSKEERFKYIHHLYDENECRIKDNITNQEYYTLGHCAVLLNQQNQKIVELEKALELACLVISKAMCPNGNWETLKIDFANAYKEQAKEMMKSE